MIAVTFDQTHSYYCTHYYPVEIAKLGRTATQLITALSMLEGCLPVSTLVPSLHAVTHYGHQTAKFSRLGQYAMWSFEQFNQLFKSQWVRNKNHPMTSAGIFLDIVLSCPTSLSPSTFLYTCQCSAFIHCGRCRKLF